MEPEGKAKKEILIALLLIAALAFIYIISKDRIELFKEAEKVEWMKKVDEAEKTEEQIIGGSISLSWEANKESDLAGYKIYYGLSPKIDDCPMGGYTDFVDVGNSTSYKIDNLEKSKTYYFSITSYDTSGNESCFSREVSKIIPAE